MNGARPAHRGRQRGVALIALLAVLATGTLWFMVSKVEELNRDYAALARQKNAEALKRAKLALIGYVAAQAVKPGEGNPGALPCPEAPGYFDSPTQEGQTASSCTQPAVGRFPWRTVGTEKLVDAAGEPLWYVVGNGWARPGSGNTVINSNSIGTLTLDGVANDAVALIIAPGQALNVTDAGCTAWNQARPTSGTPDLRNYLECANATSPADATFVTSGPANSFNDQIVKVTVADLMPAIEAAIAQRIEQEIAPAIRDSAVNTWGSVYPFAAPFSNPSTAAYEGATGRHRGLLPVTYSTSGGSTCIPAAGTACNPNLVTWQSSPAPVYNRTGGNGQIASGTISCSVATTTVSASPLAQTTRIDCSMMVWRSVFTPTDEYNFRLQATASNIARVLRTLDTSVTIANVNTSGRAASASMNADGSALITLTGVSTSGSGTPQAVSSCGFYGPFDPIFYRCWSRPVSFPVSIIADHPVTKSDDTDHGWFTRNGWHQLTYYAVAPGYSASVLPAARSCTTASSCLTVGNLAPSGAQRALLILAGRSLNGNARHSGTISDYLESLNAQAIATLAGPFERQTPNMFTAASVVADTGTANAYSISTTLAGNGATVKFRPANTNTGAATLNTPGTGARNLVKISGGALVALDAGDVQAGSPVEATYDGSQFVLQKRPFNDRIVVVDTN